MALNRGTQKQIAQRFKGNLDYFRKPHYWRRIRSWTILVVCVLGTAAMGVIYFSGNEAIYNPGPISSAHARIGHDCSQCHDLAKRTLAGATMKLTNFRIDARCQNCHAKHSFHQANVVNERGCTVCHQEHQGSGPMAMPDNSQCLQCHADAKEMSASAEKGAQLSPGAFDIHPAFGAKAFKTLRPRDGLTTLITSFEKDHPEFRLLADKLHDDNTLKFNHRRHLVETNDIPLVNGRSLDCAFCHQPGPRGAFFRKVSFEQHCRVCHTLQFDEQNPGLTIPHGRAEHVRAYLRSLPLQFAELAQRNGKSTDAFVATNMNRLRAQFIDGTNLEHQVFFANSRKAFATRTKFDGCATCHEVKANSANAPAITAPEAPDHWMPRAHFDHAKHASVDCAKCHNARASSLTSDVIMPSKAACIECHSVKGKVSNDCASCHSYHNVLPRPEFTAQ